MPNHVTNIVTCVNPAVTQALQSAEKRVDFGLIIPPPDHPDHASNVCSHDHFRSLTSDPHPNCWYVWNREHWGTKWNGYDAEPVEGGIRFDTAWTHPFPVIEALSKRFPDETLRVEYADEDLGRNQGIYTIKAGVVLETLGPDDGTEEATDHAARVKYGKTYAELRAEWGEEDEEED